MAGKIYTFLSRAVIILTALAFSQFPAFENSYKQRLGGHVDELRYQVEQMEGAAKLSGKTLDELIAKFMANADEDFRRLGELMHAAKMRLTSLENALFSLNGASPLSRPFLFFFHSDAVIMKSAYQKFRLSLPLSIEGLIWAVIGAFCGYFIFLLCAKGCRGIRAVLKKNPASSSKT